MAEQEKVRPEGKPAKGDKRKKRRRRRLITAGIFLAFALAGGIYLQARLKEAKKAQAPAEEKRTARVEKRDIVSQLSSSGTLAPKDTYEITSLVEGEVVLADFEEGDQVEKGQVLYQLDASSVESEVQSASNSLNRARDSYSDAVSDYQEILADYSGNTYKATKSGYIKKLHIDGYK